MAGKRGQALLDALLIPDIRIYRTEHRQFCVQRRNEHPRLAHEDKEAYSLQGHCFAPRIGTGDQQRVKGLP